MQSTLLGETIGGYRIERRLGSGGMGTVFAARATVPAAEIAEGQAVALKVIHPHVLLLRPDVRRRLRLETALGLRVRHRNVVQTFASIPAEVGGFETVALVMELVEGRTLRALLSGHERMPEPVCRGVGEQIADGLAAIHAAGAVHRDLKPENVICTPATARCGEAPASPASAARCVVKIMDLGVARLLSDNEHHSLPGTFVGSLDYAAPEQFTAGGTHVDHRLDLYALGLLLYEIATGNRPFAAHDIPGLIACTLREVPPRLRSVAPELSPFFARVVHTLLHKDPATRFADAATVMRVLRDGEASPWWRERRPG